MKTAKLIGAALALTFSTSAFAAADCCKDMACCAELDGKKSSCCDKAKDKGKADDHSGHDMSGKPNK